MAAPVVHRSKIDTWLLVVFGGAALGAFAACLPLFHYGLPSEIVFASMTMLVFTIALPYWILATTSYTVDDELLTIRSGPFSWRVPLREITAITPTRNPLSSPALSLDRIRIDYGAGSSIMISPAECRRFLQDLAVRGVAAACGDGASPRS